MKFTSVQPPREFEVSGGGRPVRMRDCARIALEPDEQVTFTTPGGAEYDLARKSWGYYATPSLNGRLKQFGLRPALVRNPSGRHYLLVQEAGGEAEFQRYLAEERMDVVCWLDEEAALLKIGRAFAGGDG
jgi:hypothetical protein